MFITHIKDENTGKHTIWISQEEPDELNPVAKMSESFCIGIGRTVEQAKIDALDSLENAVRMLKRIYERENY